MFPRSAGRYRGCVLAWPATTGTEVEDYYGIEMWVVATTFVVVQVRTTIKL